MGLDHCRPDFAQRSIRVKVNVNAGWPYRHSLRLFFSSLFPNMAAIEAPCSIVINEKKSD